MIPCLIVSHEYWKLNVANIPWAGSALLPRLSHGGKGPWEEGRIKPPIF